MLSLRHSFVRSLWTSSKTLLVTQNESVLTVSFNRPEMLNAANIEMMQDFISLANKLQENESGINAVVLAGQGRAFCTGRDLKESRTHSEQQRQLFQSLVRTAADNWANIPMPTIAAVQGFCYGWGVEVTLACDLRLAADDTIFCLPETSLAIYPGAGGTVRLPQLIPVGIAKELIFTARKFKSSEALQWGLLNRVVAANDLLKESGKLAETIAANGPLGVRGAKRVINKAASLLGQELIEYDHQNRVALNETEDFAEALAAFAEKRKPQFKGR